MAVALVLIDTVFYPLKCFDPYTIKNKPTFNYFKYAFEHAYDPFKCFESDHGCSEHAECVDNDGSYTCECHEGYRSATKEAFKIRMAYGRDNEGCIDIDECEDSSLNDCHIEAQVRFRIFSARIVRLLQDIGPLAILVLKSLE